MALECDSNGGSRAIPVLGHNEVRLASARRFPLVGILTVQKNDDVCVLFNTIVTNEAIGDKVVCALYCGVVDGLRSEWLDGDNLVPIHVAAGGLAKRFRVQGVGTAQQPGPGRAALVQGGAAVVSADSRLEPAIGQTCPDAFGLDQVPDLDRQSVGVGVRGPAV